MSKVNARGSAWFCSSKFFSLGWKCSGENLGEGSLSSVHCVESPGQRTLQDLLPTRAHSSGARFPQRKGGRMGEQELMSQCHVPSTSASKEQGGGRAG